MKFLALLTWVGQFGVSVVFPTLLFLLLANWLHQSYSLGLWIYWVLGTIGILTSISTTRSCLRSLLKAADEAANRKEPPIAFNDHN